MKTAVKALDNLMVDNEAPQKDGKEWGCLYSNGETLGIALTPPPPAAAVLKALKLRYQRSF